MEIFKTIFSNTELMKILGITFLFGLSLHVLKFTIQIKQARKINRTIHSLANNSLELTPKEYLELRNKKLYGEKARHANTQNFSGVYILHNISKDLIYVGQSIKVLDRIGNHFKGNGNGDVYADYKYGDEFKIRTISLDLSPYDNLNDLERHAIKVFGAYEKGYNKNRGNKR